MSLLLIILQIIGALPQVIKFAQMVWEAIKQIRGRRERVAAKKKFYAIVLRRKNIKKMSADDQQSLLLELEGLHSEVSGILKMEGVI